MSLGHVLSVGLVLAGLLFFVAGTAGLLRFPDAHTRLHALTKADNLGLGLIAVGVAIHMADAWSAAKLLLIWLLAVLAAATVAQLVARAALPRLPDAEVDDAPRCADAPVMPGDVTPSPASGPPPHRTATPPPSPGSPAP